MQKKKMSNYRKLPALITVAWIRKHFSVALKDVEIQQEIDKLNAHNVESVVDLYELTGADFEQMNLVNEMRVLLMVDVEKKIENLEQRLSRLEWLSEKTGNKVKN